LAFFTAICFDDEFSYRDLSRWVDARAKDKINEVTAKETYVFGDLTRELGRRVASRKYTLDDLVVLLKALVSFRVGLSPVAAFLPVKLLVDLLNYSIAGDLGNRLVASLAQEIDKRIKHALTGDSEYQVGGLSSSTQGLPYKFECHAALLRKKSFAYC